MAEERDINNFWAVLNWATGAEDYRLHTNDVIKECNSIYFYWSLVYVEDVIEGRRSQEESLANANLEYEATRHGGRAVQEASPNVARNAFLAAYWIGRAALRTGSEELIDKSSEYFNLGSDLLRQFGNEYEWPSKVSEIWEGAFKVLQEYEAANPGDAAALQQSFTFIERLGDVSLQREDADFTNEQHVSGGDIIEQGTKQTGDDISEGGNKTWDVLSGLFTGKRPPWMPEGQWLTIRFTTYGIAGLYVVGKVAPIVQAVLPKKPRRRRRRLDDENFE